MSSVEHECQEKVRHSLEGSIPDIVLLLTRTVNHCQSLSIVQRPTTTLAFMPLIERPARSMGYA